MFGDFQGILRYFLTASWDLFYTCEFHRNSLTTKQSAPHILAFDCYFDTKRKTNESTRHFVRKRIVYIFFLLNCCNNKKKRKKKAWKKERRKGNYFEYEMDKSAGLTIYCYAGFDVLIISWVYSPLPLFSLFEVKWRDFLLFSFFFFDVVVVWLTSMLCIDIMRRLAALLLKDMAQIHHAFCCCCCCCCRLVFVASFTRLMMLAFWRSRGGRINGA